MKVAVYTSCTLRDYPNALNLMNSIQQHSTDVSVTLCLCDNLLEGLNPVSDGFDQIWSLHDLELSKDWIFKHNKQELCEAVKGVALKKLMTDIPDADFYVYFDPTVYVYQSLQHILKSMGDASIGVLPYNTSVQETAVGKCLIESPIISTGTYTLGHLFIKSDSIGHSFASWWANHLENYAVTLFDFHRCLEIVPAIFENVKIVKDQSLNVTTANTFDRNIQECEDNHFSVNGEPLSTFCFSDWSPEKTSSDMRNTFDSGNGAVAEIERQYDETIAKQGHNTLNAVQSIYDQYDDETPVTDGMRILYRQHSFLQDAYPDPYDNLLEDNFLSWLLKFHPTLTKGLQLSSDVMEKVFHELFDENYYLETYEDVPAVIESGKFESALDHYIKIGSNLLYDPNDLFVSCYYLDKIQQSLGVRSINADCSIRDTLLWHYLETGLPNNIEPIEYFDSNWYLTHYTDIGQAYRAGDITCPFSHYFTNGCAEDRLPGPNVKLEHFMGNNPSAQNLQTQHDIKGIFRVMMKMGKISGRMPG
jgi:hypothetical protein